MKSSPISPTHPSSKKSVNTYQLHRDLQKVEGLERLKESEVRTPTFKIKLLVFTALLELNDITSCSDLMASREEERLKEKREGKSLEQRRMSEHAYRRIYSKIVAKTLKRMKGEDDSVSQVQQLALDLFGKQSTPKQCHRAMNFLFRHGMRHVEQVEEEEDKRIAERNESKVMSPKSLRTPGTNNIGSSRSNNNRRIMNNDRRQIQLQQQQQSQFFNSNVNNNTTNRNNMNQNDLSQSFIGVRSMEILNPDVDNSNNNIQPQINNNNKPPQKQQEIIQQDRGLSLLDFASPSALMTNYRSDNNNKNNIYTNNNNNNNQAHPMYIRYMEQRVLQLERNVEMLNASLHAQASVVDETEHVLLELRDEIMKQRVKNANDGDINSKKYDSNALTYDRIDSLFGRVKAAQREAGRTRMDTAMSQASYTTNKNDHNNINNNMIRQPSTGSNTNNYTTNNKK